MSPDEHLQKQKELEAQRLHDAQKAVLRVQSLKAALLQSGVQKELLDGYLTDLCDGYRQALLDEKTTRIDNHLTLALAVQRWRDAVALRDHLARIATSPTPVMPTAPDAG